MPIDSLSELRAFVAIIETGSFTAAARRLGLTVNATSRRLQQLEASVGTKLIERTTRRSAPTEAGRRLHVRAGPILDALFEAEAELHTSATQVEGVVTLALPAVVAGRAFLAHLERLLVQHPGLRVDLRVGSTQLPGEGGVDLAIVVGQAPDSFALVGRRIGTHRWGLAASPAYVKARGAPKRPADLSRHVCLRFRGDVPQRTWSLAGPGRKRAVVKVDGTFECDDSRVLGDATYAGLGIGVRPESELAEAVSRGDLVHVLPEWRFGELPTHLLTTPGRRGLKRVALVSEVIVLSIRGLR
jgi:DNA-binding transcriptional LysR family regulator